MTYENFTKYPIQILGINESYNDELTAINDFVVSDIEYSGDVADLESVLPYFVFFNFCENARSEVYANTGESATVKEHTVPSDRAQIAAWNFAVKELSKLCTDNQKTVNEKYLSLISPF